MNIEGRTDVRQGGQVAPHKSVKPKPNPRLPDAAPILLRRTAGLMRAHVAAVVEPPPAETAARLRDSAAALSDAERVFVGQWTPAVALAVADWLDDVAGRLDSGLPAQGVDLALRVQRAYYAAEAEMVWPSS